jgi:hypothetical protein
VAVIDHELVSEGKSVSESLTIWQDTWLHVEW